MNLLQQLQGILGEAGGALNSGQKGSEKNEGFGGNLSKLLGPAMLGGLAGALLTSKTARGIAGGALLAGTGAAVWNQLKNTMRERNSGSSPYSNHPEQNLAEAQGPASVSAEQATPLARSERLVRALVFAAKSDGHIDGQEQSAIFDSLQKLRIGSEAQALVQRAMNEPLDPALIANGVTSEEEALELYTLSYAVVDVDHFMERSYLNALAQALNIPDDVKEELEKHLRSQDGK